MVLRRVWMTEISLQGRQGDRHKQSVRGGGGDGFCCQSDIVAIGICGPENELLGP